MQDVKCGAMLCGARCGGAMHKCVANTWCDLKLMWRGVHGMWHVSNGVQCEMSVV